MLKKVVIVDFGSQVTQLIARSVRSQKVYCEVVPFNKFSLKYKGEANKKNVVINVKSVENFLIFVNHGEKGFFDNCAK